MQLGLDELVQLLVGHSDEFSAGVNSHRNPAGLFRGHILEDFHRHGRGELPNEHLLAPRIQGGSVFVSHDHREKSQNLRFDPLLVQEIYRINYKEGDIADSGCINYKNWETMYPIFPFSLENVEGDPHESKTNTTIDFCWSLSDVAAASYTAYALIFSEATLYLDAASGKHTVRMA